MTDQHGGDLYWTEQNAYWMVLVCDSCLDYITGPRHAWDMGNNPDHGHDMIRERQTVMMVHADKLLDYINQLMGVMPQELNTISQLNSTRLLACDIHPPKLYLLLTTGHPDGIISRAYLFYHIRHTASWSWPPPAHYSPSDNGCCVLHLLY